MATSVICLHLAIFYGPFTKYGMNIGVLKVNNKIKKN